MPPQHWTVYFMFIARGWVLNSLQGEYWKILSLGIGLYTHTAERRDVQPDISRLEAVYGHSLIINPSLGMYQEIHPCNDVRMGNPSPPPSRFPSSLEISRVSGNILGVGDGFPNTSLDLVEHGYNLCMIIKVFEVPKDASNKKWLICCKIAREI